MVTEQRNDRGSTLPLFAVIVAVAASAVLLLVMLAEWAVRRAEAQSAADAAALAGAVEGRDGAADLAARNGATLSSWRVDGSTVVVAVDLGSVRAWAAATTGGWSDLLNDGNAAR